ncbi:hypothetical protein ACRRTK_006195 [Alexandromys fortis]
MACATGGRLCIVNCPDFCSLGSGTVTQGNSANSEESRGAGDRNSARSASI